MKKMRKNRGKGDKHSKICTSKGERDRRIRLSANTAIQFYDVQDRLGYDRPTNAIDWLMKEAKAAIDLLNAHHLLLLPEHTTPMFNRSQAFHRTPGDHHQTNSFNNHPFEEEEEEEENPVPFPQGINVPTHFPWNPNYNARDGFEFVNFHLPIVHTPDIQFTNDDDGLLGFTSEQEIQVQEEVKDQLIVHIFFHHRPR